MKLIPIITSLSLLSFFHCSSSTIFAGPQSTSYELKTYEFGSGGTQETVSSNYSLQGSAGNTDNSSITSTNYQTNPGLSFANQANTPAAPALSNPATNYDRLKIIIDSGNNPADATFAIAISNDNFATNTDYVQSDNTTGTTLGAEDWLSYPSWGGATGVFIKTLKANTTYTVKVKAQSGKYTETPWSATGTAATVTPSLTFGISLNTLNFDNLNSGNSYTDSTKSTVITTSTNAYNGYNVYGHETGVLTSGSNTIADYASPNSAPSSWTGTGFGYTTSDSSLVGGTADRFTNPSANYAGFTTSAPGDPVADHTAVVESSAISNEQFTISYRVTASATTKAGNYTNKIIYVVVPTY